MLTAVCIPSRNRPEALVECIASIVRVLALKPAHFSDFVICVRQNSDKNLSHDTILESVVSLTGINFPPSLIHIHSNNNVVFMHENCEYVVSDALNIGADFILTLPDRRLLTSNIFSALSLINDSEADVLVFDNQAFWLSSETLTQTRQIPEVLNPKSLSPSLINDIFNCRFDGLTPRLYNCLVRSSYFTRTFSYFGSYIAAPCPDISFQFRCAFLPNTHVHISRLTVIVTNARHASATVSNTGIPNKASLDKKNITEQRGIFGLHKTIVYVGCLSHITDYVSHEDLHLFVSAESLLQALFWEMSCPQTPSLFSERLTTITDALMDRSNSLFSRLSVDKTVYWLNLFSNLSNTPAELQCQPLQDQSDPLVMSSFDPLLKIEAPLL